MTHEHDAKTLAEAVRNGELTLEAALEEHLGGKTDEPEESVIRTLAHHNMGWQERTVDLGDRSVTVAEFVRELGLAPFLPLLDRHEESLYSLGDIVIYEGQSNQVIGRREVSPLAAPRFDDWELLIEALDGSTSEFVGEGHVEALDDENSSAE